MLNIVYQAGTITRDNVLETMRAFIDARQLEEILDGFVEERWLDKPGGAMTRNLRSPMRARLNAKPSSSCSAR